MKLTLHHFSLTANHVAEPGLTEGGGLGVSRHYPMWFIRNGRQGPKLPGTRNNNAKPEASHRSDLGITSSMIKLLTRYWRINHLH